MTQLLPVFLLVIVLRSGTLGFSTMVQCSPVYYSSVYYRLFPDCSRPGLHLILSSPFLVNNQDHHCCVVCTQGDTIDGPCRVIFINQSYQAFQKQPCFCQLRWANIGLSLNIHQELFLKWLFLNRRHLKLSQPSLQVNSKVMYFAGVCWLIMVLWHHEKPWWLVLCSCGESKARPSDVANSFRLVGVQAEGGIFFHPGSHQRSKKPQPDPFLQTSWREIGVPVEVWWSSDIWSVASEITDPLLEKAFLSFHIRTYIYVLLYNYFCLEKKYIAVTVN